MKLLGHRHIFNFTANCFPKSLYQFTQLSKVHKNSHCFMSLPTCGIIRPFNFANLVGDGCSLWLYFVSLRLLVIRTSYHLNFLRIIFYWDITDINIVLVLGVQLKDLIYVYIFVFLCLICFTYHKVPKFYPCCGKWLPFLKIGF